MDGSLIPKIRDSYQGLGIGDSALMPGSIDLVALAAIVVLLWILTVVFRVTSRWALYFVFRRVLLTAVVLAIVAFCWNLVLAFR